MKATTILQKARLAAVESGLTYQQIGGKMGYPEKSARQSISQFLNGRNPSAAMILRFAEAIGVDAKDLLED